MIRYSDEDIIYNFFCKLMQEYNLDVILKIDPTSENKYYFEVENLSDIESTINYEEFNSLRRNIRINRYF